MSMWRQLTRGLRGLFRPAAADGEVREEVEHYLREATDDLVSRGLSPDDARRTVRLELGTAAGVGEEARRYGWERTIGALAGDLRYAVRQLRSDPGFTAVTVLTLALGLGATTAIFSAVNPILFKPLPYPDAGRVSAILELQRDGGHSGGTFGMYQSLAHRNRSFDAIAVFKPWQPTVTGTQQPERLEGQRVSAAFFRVLGVGPIAGRDFEPSDDRFKGPNVVILSDALWRRRFDADRGIVGRAITLDDSLFTVVGVMPAGFENVLGPAVALWAPLQYDPTLPAQGREWGHHLRTIGRLRPGVGIAEASGEIDRLGRAVVNELKPSTYDPQTQFAVALLQDELTRGVRPALLAIVAAVVLVLVIACVNVTNLLLGRGVRRRGEFALRAALGAGSGRLVRQLLAESLLLAAIGGAVGMAVAWLGVRALVALTPPDLPRAAAIGVDASVFAFGLGITTLMGLAFGVMPALQAARRDPRGDLSHGSRHTAGGHRRLRRALVVAEVALALVLLVSSGLLLRSLERLFAVPIGFDPSHLLTLQVQESGHRFIEDPARYRFFADALEAVRHVPGVAAAAFTSQLPLSGDRDEYGATFEATPTRPAETYGVFRYAVSPGYLETMRIPLLRGRLLDERDGAGAPLAAVISESVWKGRFHGADPIGERLRIGGSPTAPPFTIVGVVGDVKQLSLALNQSDAVYHPAVQGRWVDTVTSFVVRTHGDAAAMAPAIRAAIWSIDPDQPVVRVSTVADLVTVSAAERRFALLLFQAFALSALVLAAAGIYGVLSGSVVERTREIGVRAALGASRSAIVALVARQALSMTALGLVFGLAGAAAAAQAIAAMLFGVSPLDPLTYLGVVALLTAMSAVACAVPAWRAARVDPAITLRSE
jgi:putative ABC transport system permease protein